MTYHQSQDDKLAATCAAAVKTAFEDGGPAFPSPGYSDDGERRGMTLRDWLAGQALNGFLANGSQRLIAEALEDDPNRSLIQDSRAKAAIVNEQLAIGAYLLADAMLRARKT